MAKSKWYLEHEMRIANVKRTLVEARFSNTAIDSDKLNEIKDVMIILMNRVAYLESVVPEDKK